MRQVFVFDTTLRDGEQTPGISFTQNYKIQLAKQLDKLGLDVIEAGFPASSKGEFETVKQISDLSLNSQICGLSRIVKNDIDAALDAEVDMVHIFISTSDIQIEHTINKSKEEIVNMAVDAVEYIKENGRKCMFSAMDATRTDLNYLKHINKAVEEAGVDVVNIPDTVGVATPFKFHNLIKDLRNELKVPIDVHCHNDLGMAVSNTYAAVLAGADEVQVTVNGLGERAGNASLAEVVMILQGLEDIKTNINTQYLVETSKLLERLTGIKLPPNTPIVGDNAFSHESGIHAHGVIKESSTFEPGFITPEMVGHKRRLGLGKHAGKHQVKKMLEDAGYSVNEEQVTTISQKIKELGDKGKKITDLDLYTLAEVVIGELREEEKAINVNEVTVLTGNKITPTAVINADIMGQKKVKTAIGVGPVDAALGAVSALVERDIKITEFRMDAITGGSDALAEVYVTVEDDDGDTFTARSAGPDIIMSSIDAVIRAINHLMHRRKSKESRKNFKL